jgi:two-component system, LytTR family, sensor kinase
MKLEQLAHRSLARSFVIVGLCILAGSLFSFIPYVVGFVRVWPVNFGALMAWQLIYWLIWGGIAAIIGVMVRWMVSRKLSIWRMAAWHLPICLLLSLFHSWLFFSAYLLIRRIGISPFGREIFFGDVLIHYSNSNLLVYVMIVGGFHYLGYSRLAHEKDLHTVRLTGQLAQAQLKALRMQIHPHFLFNTLNTVVSLIRRDPALAETVIIRLADLLRLTLSASDAPKVRLENEVEYVRHYLEIQRIRTGGRIQSEWHVAPETLGLSIPPLLLLPLVENAVEHGLGNVGGRTGMVAVHVRIEAEWLTLRVEDNGCGMNESAPAGVGLSNTRERLQSVLGDRFRFHLLNGEAGGAVAEIHLPLETCKEEG